MNRITKETIIDSDVTDNNHVAHSRSALESVSVAPAVAEQPIPGRNRSAPVLMHSLGPPDPSLPRVHLSDARNNFAHHQSLAGELKRLEREVESTAQAQRCVSQEWNTSKHAMKQLQVNISINICQFMWAPKVQEIQIDLKQCPEFRGEYYIAKYSVQIRGGVLNFRVSTFLGVAPTD